MAESAEGICKSSGTDPFHNQLPDAAESKLHADRVFTTGSSNISREPFILTGRKDFTPVIEKALELGGYEEDQQFTGINGGTTADRQVLDTALFSV